MAGNTRGGVKADQEELARLRRELARVTAERHFFKASGGVVPEAPQMRYQAIRDNAGRFAVSLMCSALQVSTSGYYAWRDRLPSPRAHANERLLSQIREARRCSRGTYGSPRITHELRAQATVRVRIASLGQWPKLTTFLVHGEVPLDNNRCENAIRPFVISRKGWLFSDTVKGGIASANLYSIVETAKVNGVEPHAYLS